MSEDENKEIVTKVHGKIPMSEDTAITTSSIGSAVEKFRKMPKDEQIAFLMETVLVQATENQLLRSNIQELNRHIQDLEQEIKVANKINKPHDVRRVTFGAFRKDDDEDDERAGRESTRVNFR